MLILHAIHGFLGSPTDWVFPPIQGEIHRVAIADRRWGGLSSTLDEWGEAFAAFVRTEWGARRDHILLGYSLGGRLALHAWHADPSLWKRVILVSTHPGLSSEKEREQRLLSDRQWAERWATEPWVPLLTEWNRQPVFQGDDFFRPEPENRAILAEQLERFSLGKQGDFREKILSSTDSFSWIAGGCDQKFAEIARSMREHHPTSRAWIVANAYHRVPWEQPAWWKKWILLATDDVEACALQ